MGQASNRGPQKQLLSLELDMVLVEGPRQAYSLQLEAPSFSMYAQPCFAGGHGPGSCIHEGVAILAGSQQLGWPQEAIDRLAPGCQPPQQQQWPIRLVQATGVAA